MHIRRGAATLFLMFAVVFGGLAVPQKAQAAEVVAVVVAVATAVGSVVASVASLIYSVVTAVGALIANLAAAAWTFAVEVVGAFSAAFTEATFAEGIGTLFTQLGGAIGNFGAALSGAFMEFFATVGDAWAEFTESMAEAFGLGGESAPPFEQAASGCNPSACASAANVPAGTTVAGVPASGGVSIVEVGGLATEADVIIITASNASLPVIDTVTGALTMLTVPSMQVPGMEGAGDLTGKTIRVEHGDGSFTDYTFDEYVGLNTNGHPIFTGTVTDGFVITGNPITGVNFADAISVISGASIGEPGTAASVALILALFNQNNSIAGACPVVGVKVFEGTGTDMKNKYVYVDTFKNHVDGMNVDRPSEIFHGTGDSPSAQGARSCRLVDPTSFPTCWTARGYSSPNDDIVMKWNGTKWFHNAASGNNNWYGDITCSTLARPEAQLIASRQQVLPGTEVSLLWSSPYGDVRQASCVAENFDLVELIPAHQECWQSVEGGEGGNPIVIDICEDVPDTYEPRPYVGSTEVTVNQTTTFSYTCSNVNGSRTDEVTVEVVSASELPNLTAGALSPTNAVVNTPITLSAVVSNTGSGQADPSTTLIQIDTDEDHNTIPYAGFSSNGEIVPGGTSLASVSQTFTAEGPYYGRACADSLVTPPGLGTIMESDEDDNCGPWTPILVTNSALPDLIVTTPVSPTETPAGVPITFSATVVNVGLGATPAGFSNLFQIDDDGVAPILVERADVSPVLIAPANDVTQVSHTFSTQGAYKVRACTDAGADLANPMAGAIFESDETNNCGPWTDVTVLASSAQCTDGIDNDGDGTIDGADADCGNGGPNGEGYNCTVSSNSVPLGGSVTYTARNGSGPYTWTASDGTPIPSTSATAVRTFTTAGSYGMSVSGASPFTNRSCPLVSACDVCLPPVVSIRALPTLVDPRAPGGSATLYWTADTGSCTITSSQTGSIFSGTPTGIEQTLPVSGITRQTRYTLSCTNPAGTSQASVMVNILGKFDEI
jgi:hypothetical protein